MTNFGSYDSKIIPELGVSDIKKSLFFWCDLIGFEIYYGDPESGFVCIDYDGAEIVLNQNDLSNSTWETAPLEYPRGRGVNFELEVENTRPISSRLKKAGIKLYQEERDEWDRIEEVERGYRKFLVIDPDGYLLKIIQNLGLRVAKHPK